MRENIYDEDLIRQDVQENPEMLRALANHFQTCERCAREQQELCFRVFEHLKELGSLPEKTLGDKS